jgi:hypothetical protein
MDVATKYVWIYTMTSKEQTKTHIERWLLEMRTAGKIAPSFTTFRTDNGGEFTSAKMIQLLLSSGVRRELSPPYAHVYMAERLILTLREMVRSSLYAQQVSLGFWAEAIHYSVYLLNRMPLTNKATITRYGLFHGRKPSISNVRTFGCPVYARQYDHLTHKWEERAWLGMFVGLNSASPKTWKADKPSTREFISTSYVKAGPREKQTGFLVCFFDRRKTVDENTRE